MYSQTKQIISFFFPFVLATRQLLISLNKNVQNKMSENIVGECWGMANDGEWRTGQYLVEGVKAIKCFHPRYVNSPYGKSKH